MGKSLSASAVGKIVHSTGLGTSRKFPYIVCAQSIVLVLFCFLFSIFTLRSTESGILDIYCSRNKLYICTICICTLYICTKVLLLIWNALSKTPCSYTLHQVLDQRPRFPWSTLTQFLSPSLKVLSEWFTYIHM